MRWLLTTRHRALLICTGDDAREDAPAADAPAIQAVTGSPWSADTTVAPPAAWNPEVEPYEEHKRIGFP